MPDDVSTGTEGATVQKTDAAPAPAPAATAPTMVRELRVIPTGFGMADRVEARVRALKAGEAVPAGAEAAPDGTPKSDWVPYGQGRPDGVPVVGGS